MGWRQGAILDSVQLKALKQAGVHEGNESIAVVITHSCDLAERQAAVETEVELLLAEEIPEVNGNLTYGKSPRRLHLAADLPGDDLRLAFDIRRRLLVPREMLLSEPPPNRNLASKDSALLARWVGKRYWREAFPDALNSRFKVVESRMRKALKGEGGSLLSGLYLVGDIDAELPDATSYAFDLVGTVEHEPYGNPDSRSKAQAALDQLGASMNEAAGIEVGEIILAAESAVTLNDLRYFRRWDYDDLSLRTEGASMAPE